MTALPKHWPSSRRQGKRRAGQKAKALRKPVSCPHCQMPKISGFLCPNCHQ